MRRREISPSFWTDERVWNLSSDGCRLLLPGIWMIADRDGRLIDKPFDIGVQARPWDVRVVPGMIDEIVSAGLLVRYAVRGVGLLAVPPDAWKRHQRPHPQESPSKLPGIPEGAWSPKVLPWEDPGVTHRSPPGGSSSSQAFQASQASQDLSSLSSLSGPDLGSPSPKKPKARKKKPAAQVEPKPPRTPTVVDRLHAYFLEARADRCAQLGMEEPPPDDTPNWPRTGATLATWIGMRSSQEAGEVFAKLIIGAYLEDPYWAGATNRETGTSQPYPWNALLSEKVWKRLVEQLDREHAAEAGAA